MTFYIHSQTHSRLEILHQCFSEILPWWFCCENCSSNYLALRHFLKKTWFYTSVKRKWPPYNSFSVLSDNLNQEWLQTPQNFFHTHLFFSQINWVNWFVKIEMNEKCPSSNCRKQNAIIVCLNATMQTQVQRFHTKINKQGPLLPMLSKLERKKARQMGINWKQKNNKTHILIELKLNLDNWPLF